MCDLIGFLQMGKTFKSSPGTADNGTCRPENRLHKPIAFEITFGTCQVTVKESKCLRRRQRSKSFHFFSFANSKMFDAKWETSSVHHSKSLNFIFFIKIITLCPSRPERSSNEKKNKRQYFFVFLFNVCNNKSNRPFFIW